MKKTLAFYLAIAAVVVAPAGFSNATQLSANPGAKLSDKELAAYLVGTWVPSPKDAQMERSETTFFDDGRWEYIGVFTREAMRRGSPEKLEIEGTYFIEGGVCVETATKMNPELVPLPDTKRFRILEVRDDSHATESLQSGKLSRYKRKKLSL